MVQQHLSFGKFSISLVLALGLLAASPAYAQPARVVTLFAGCNNISVTFPTGTSSSAVASTVSPANSVDALWRLDNAAGRYLGFAPAAPQASDLLTVGFLDAVFVCVTQQASMSMPGVPAPAPVQPSTPSPPALTPVPTATTPSLSSPPVTQESGGVAVTVLNVMVVDASDWGWGKIEGAITVGVIDVQVSNGNDRWISICPYVAGATTGDEEAIVSPPSSALLSTEDICADYAPGAAKTGKVVFFLRYTQSSEVTAMRYTFFGPTDAASFESLGPSYDFQIAVP